MKSDNQSIKVDFEKSMMNSYLYDFDFADNNKEWRLVKLLYENNFLNQSGLSQRKSLIPKIIHQIWLGGELPEKYKKLSESWKKFHPDWEYHLWTEKNITNLKLINQVLINKTNNLGAKSDMLRYEILYQFGGLYIDTDFECLRSFDGLNNCCEFFTGIGYRRNLLLNNGLIASIAHHPLLIKIINNIAQNDKVDTLDPNKLMETTGPQFFTNQFIPFAKKTPKKLIAFPVTYFYPLPNNKRFENEFAQNRLYLNLESYCVHYWDSSWSPKNPKDKIFYPLVLAKKQYKKRVNDNIFLKITFKFYRYMANCFNYLYNFYYFNSLVRKDKRFCMQLKDIKPMLNDNTSNTGFDWHYIYHPAWAARVLSKTKPEFHIDIASTLNFSSIVSAFVPIKFYDYRPADIKLSNFESRYADLTKLPFVSNSIKSLSCMHTIEHIGLGRYGDIIDYNGDLKAINELKRVMKVGGNLLIVVPIGKPKIVFNAHRIYSYNQIMAYFMGFNLKEFALVLDPGYKKRFVTNPDKKTSDTQKYGCGCFWFRREK